MSVGTVITLGYGTFGTVNFLPPLGYGNFTPPSPPVITTPNLSGSIGSAPFGRTFIQQVKSPKKEPYKFRRSMENQDRTDIEAIMQILAKGGFL